MRGKSLLHRGSLTFARAVLRQRAGASPTRNCATCLPGISSGMDAHRRHGAPVYAESGAWDPVARMQHVDLFTWLRGDILVKADKMTMANSLELRVPFLDPEVFAVASKLPVDAEDHQGTTTKYALRPRPRVGRPRHMSSTGAKLGFPGADSALAAGRPAAGLGARDGQRHRQADYLIDRCGGAADARGAPLRAHQITADGCGRC